MLATGEIAYKNSYNYSIGMSRIVLLSTKYIRTERPTKNLLGRTASKEKSTLSHANLTYHLRWKYIMSVDVWL